MGIGKIHSAKKMLFQLVLLGIPTIIFVCFILWRLNDYYTILENAYLSQGSYFAIGCLTSVFLFSFRFRFITTTIVLFLVNHLIYILLQNVSVGEFDAFFVSVKFYIFSILFSIGWVVGYGFARSKQLTIIWSTLLLIVEIILISKTSDITVSSLLNGIVPIIVYCFYIIYTAELIRNINEDETNFTWFVTKRLGLFALLFLILFVAILTMLKGNFQAIEKDWGGSKGQDGKGKANSESMTEKDKNGGVKNKDQTKLTGSLSKDKQLLFVARLDNYFPNSQVPNPLYFTSCYYTKFDTATQTFEIDDKMPYNDLFTVDPSTLPLYFRKTDTTVLRNSLATEARKIVSAEIYNVNMAPDTYLAPSTAFYCQPISVPKEYKDQYKSAYSAKMWVSDLNSAYFIYNPAGNYQLESFQELRFEKLRQIKKIKGPDDKFMKYYTYMPADEDYKKISALTKKLTEDKERPIDKIIAIRDYFLSKDEFNQPLFAYSDNPGIPGMPSANKLTYFLLENRKGYCAYFAGATLFMLRSLGIPSRVAAGFSTTDRSSKNPGWYWFYQDQAHAWVQVYFQGYGWIDFDTTIPDINTQQASQPDGTPPSEVPQIFMVVKGEVLDKDTAKKTLTIKSEQIIYHDTEFVSKTKIEILTDVSLATMSNDTGEIKLKHLEKGMLVTGVSHAEVLKEIYTKPKDSLLSVIKRLSQPIPMDEIKVIKKEEAKKDKDKKTQMKEAPFSWLNLLYGILYSVIALLIIGLLSPYFIWLWLHSRAKSASSTRTKAFAIHYASIYYLNQMGRSLYAHGPREYATEIDEIFRTNLAAFNDVYQKVKYSNINLSEGEITVLNNFYSPFIQSIRSRIPFKDRAKNFLNFYYTLHFFSKPKLN